MTFHRSQRLPTRTLAAYLEGALTVAERERIEAQIAGSDDARGRLAELRQLRSQLALPLPEEDGFDVTAAVRKALDAEPAAPPTLPRRGRGAGYAAAFAACAALAITAYQRGAPPEREFRAKAAQTGREAERWSGIHVFRVREDETPEPLESELLQGDGLLFTYRNEGREPYRYLMIFALDAAAEVHWFHPAYEQAGMDPESIPIAATSGDTLLPAVIHHDPAQGPLTFYALFTNGALRTSEVEAWLTTRPPRSSSALAPDGRLQALAFTVLP
jgi:hypothetical protein